MKQVRSLKINTDRLLNQPFRIALLLNSKLTTHCQIMRGFSDFMKEFHLNWDITLNHELKHRRGDEIDLWFDGIVGDYNHLQHRTLLEQLDIVVVGVVSGTDHLDKDIKRPLVSLNNERMMSIAHDFLIAKGLKHIACYGLIDDDEGNWQATRINTYLKLQKNLGSDPLNYQGKKATFSSWMEEFSNLSNWLDGLPKPCGIIVSSDVRARTLISACQAENIIIPDEISVISIGDVKMDELFHSISLSAVDPNYYQMGREVAAKIHKSLKNENVAALTMIEPELVAEGSSTDFRYVVDPYVLRAMHFVRNNFNCGIKVQRVVDYAGCSRSTLETKFKELIGHSLHTEIHNQKFNHAKSLLLTTEYSIAQVAEGAGFPSSKYLYGLFQKEINMTPTEFRQQYLVEPNQQH